MNSMMCTTSTKYHISRDVHLHCSYAFTHALNKNMPPPHTYTYMDKSKNYKYDSIYNLYKNYVHKVMSTVDS